MQALEKQSAIVTGAARGIGRAICLELAGRGDYPIFPTLGYERPAKVPAHCELRNFCGATQLGITLRPWREALRDYFRDS